MLLLAASMLTGAPASAQSPLQLQPTSGAPGTLVSVTGTPCLPPAGADFFSVVVKLHSSGDSWGDPGLAWGSVIRTLADWPEVLPFSVSTAPSYGRIPADAGILEPDGSWAAPLWVPYGTPPGRYDVRAECNASFGDREGEASWPLLVAYGPAPFTVTAWPPVPPTHTDCLVPAGLVVDGTGALHRWGWQYGPRGSPLSDAVLDALAAEGDWWPGRDLARGISLTWSYWESASGLVVDAFGGLHRFPALTPHGGMAEPRGVTYWPGWDIARGVAFKRWGEHVPTQGIPGWGVVLDAWGGLHPFTLGSAPSITVTPGTGPYWPGWDIAEDVAFLPSGRGGYVLDAWGGLHPFGRHGEPAPPKPAWQPYWRGWDIARGLVMLDDRSGYVVDAWGGFHPFSVDAAYQSPRPPSPYWPGRDVVRGAAVVGCSF